MVITEQHRSAKLYCTITQICPVHSTNGITICIFKIVSHIGPFTKNFPLHNYRAPFSSNNIALPSSMQAGIKRIQMVHPQKLIIEKINGEHNKLAKRSRYNTLPLPSTNVTSKTTFHRSLGIWHSNSLYNK